MKRCPKCKEEKPLTTEYFYYSYSKGRFTSPCAECQKAQQRNYQGTDLGRLTRRTRQSTEQAKAVRKAYDQREEVKARNRLAYRSNEEKKAYYKTRSQSENFKAVSKVYRQSERGKLSYKARHANSTAKQFGVPGRLTLQDVIELFAKYPACLNCGTTDDLTIDHVVPMAKGGANYPDNLQSLCQDCNEKKFTKTTDYRPPQHLTVATRSVA